jgi:ArsR family transcriptional regulator, arsenate/arsenite/antimonite-responsive transcriptional repressor
MNDFYKVLADETRLRCLALIFENEEICVCEIMHALDLPQSKISRHLSIIKLNNVISQRREGQWVLYSKEPTLSEFKTQIIQMTIQELSKSSIFKQDKKRLSTMKNRPVLSCCK